MYTVSEGRISNGPGIDCMGILYCIIALWHGLDGSISTSYHHRASRYRLIIGMNVPEGTATQIIGDPGFGRRLIDPDWVIGVRLVSVCGQASFLSFFSLLVQVQVQV